jgi:ABC-type Na+ efflux pump permease subunit
LETSSAFSLWWFGWRLGCAVGVSITLGVSKTLVSSTLGVSLTSAYTGTVFGLYSLTSVFGFYSVSCFLASRTSFLADFSAFLAANFSSLDSLASLVGSATCRDLDGSYF